MALRKDVMHDVIAFGYLAMENKTFLEEDPLTIFSEVNNFVKRLADTLEVLQ